MKRGLDMLQKIKKPTVVCAVVLLLVIYLIQYRDFETEWCKSEFLDGNISAEGVASDCPNITREDLIEVVNERYSSGDFKYELLNSINKTYWSDGEFEEELERL